MLWLCYLGETETDHTRNDFLQTVNEYPLYNMVYHGSTMLSEARAWARPLGTGSSQAALAQPGPGLR